MLSSKKVRFGIALILLTGFVCLLGFLSRTLPARFSLSSDPYASVSDIGFYFDTVVELQLNGTGDHRLIDECFDLMKNYESLLSRTREGSDVWKINHSSGEPIEISDDTAALIRLSQKYYELSGGAFDITVAPYTALWDFQNNPGNVPGDEELAAAGRHVGLAHLHLAGNTVTLDDPAAAIDLGGIAKGYIADRVKELLVGRGIRSGCINLGGNLLAIGTKPDGELWNIGIRRPFAEVSDVITTVRIDDLSVVTSGVYERYFEADGMLFHHILDPESGRPVRNGLYSVTILSESSADGDALSTACFVLGREDGMRLVESLENTEALFISDDLSLHYSPGFPQAG